MTDGDIKACTNGHEMADGNLYCTTCGQPIADLPAAVGGTHGRQRLPRKVLTTMVLLAVVAMAAVAFMVYSSANGSDDSATKEPLLIAAVRSDTEFTSTLTDDEILDAGRLNCDQARAGNLDRTFDAIAQASGDLGGDPEQVGRPVVLAITMLCPRYEDQLPASTPGALDQPSDTSPTTLTSQTSSSTTDEEATTSPGTSTPGTGGGSATEVDAARSAAVVFYTYGVTATGYPAFEDVIAPSARPSVESMIIGPDYRNAGCSQIVESIEETPLPNPPTYGWDLRLRYQCPDEQPTSSADGTPLPLTEHLYVEATVAPSPTGGYWATNVETFDNN